MPTYELILKREYNQFANAWDECETLLYSNARHYNEKQQKTLRVRIGCEFGIFQIREMNDEMTICVEDDERNEIHDMVATPVEELPHANNKLYLQHTHLFIELNVSTKIIPLENELIPKHDTIDNN